VRTAALLRVEISIRLDLSVGRMPNARSIAASSPEYGFCSDLGPSVEEKVPSFGLLYTDGGSVAAPPTPTRSFRAELLTAMRTS
jgi:hypothetical protein